METIDATPPAGFPDQVIILDRELGQRNPAKAFYLRLVTPGGVDTIDLDGAITPIEARKIAVAKGLNSSVEISPKLCNTFHYGEIGKHR